MPNFDLAIDKQLFPGKTRCPFIQYTANKPDKFGVKFWLLADAQNTNAMENQPCLEKKTLKADVQIFREMV